MNRKGFMAGYIVGILIAVAVIGFMWYQGGYNRAIALDEQVKAAWAQVENQLQRRYDLIPNLVNTVKGFAHQEKNIFLEVTRLRSQWASATSINDKIEAANGLQNVLSRLLVVSENYPQLKSDANFMALQSQIEGTENRIAVERMRYNEAVQEFNRYRRSLIGRFFVEKAGVGNPAVYFETNEKSKEVPQVNFE